MNTMLKDSDIAKYTAWRNHRTCTPSFKAELDSACQQPGASIAALASSHGMNADGKRPRSGTVLIPASLSWLPMRRPTHQTSPTLVLASSWSICCGVCVLTLGLPPGFMRTLPEMSAKWLK